MTTELSKLPQDPSVPTHETMNSQIPENIKLETSAYKNDLDAKPAPQPHMADVKKMNSMVNDVQKAAAQGLTRLSSDIPQEITHITQDTQTVSNAIPNAVPNAVPSNDSTTHIDYIQNNATREEIEAELNKQKNKETTVEYILEELKLPLLIAILYSIFQSNIFKNIIQTKAPSFIYNASGFTQNSNIYMSIIFSITMYIALKIFKVFDLNII